MLLHMLQNLPNVGALRLKKKTRQMFYKLIEQERLLNKIDAVLTLIAVRVRFLRDNASSCCFNQWRVYLFTKQPFLIRFIYKIKVYEKKTIAF